MACFSRNLLTRGDGGRSYDLRITDTFEGGTAVAHPAHSSTSLGGCGQRLDRTSLAKAGRSERPYSLRRRRVRVRAPVPEFSAPLLSAARQGLFAVAE
jgi:hypothetical protein